MEAKTCCLLLFTLCHLPQVLFLIKGKAFLQVVYVLAKLFLAYLVYRISCVLWLPVIPQGEALHRI